MVNNPCNAPKNDAKENMLLAWQGIQEHLKLLHSTPGGIMHTNAALIISQHGTFVLFAEKKQAANVLFSCHLVCLKKSPKNKQGINGCQSEPNGKRSKAVYEECFLAFFSDVVQQVKADQTPSIRHLVVCFVAALQALFGYIKLHSWL